MNKIIKDHCAFCAAYYKEDIMADSIFKDKTLLITGGCLLYTSDAADEL